MTISATERHELRGLALDAFGERGADLLMAGLAGADLDAMEERLKLRIELSQAETKTDLSGLRGEFAELRGEFGELRGDFGRLEGLVGKEVGSIRAELANQTRVLYFAVVATVLGIASLAYSAFQLGR